MRKLLARVRYPKNGAAISLYQVGETRGVPKQDTVMLSLKGPKDTTRWYMRPDEAMALLQVVTTGLHKMVKGYVYAPLKQRGDQRARR